MSRTNCAAHTHPIRVSTVSRTESLHQRKTFNIAVQVHVTRGRPFHSFTRNHVVPEHYVTNELTATNRHRCIIHTKIERHHSLDPFLQKTQVRSLETQLPIKCCVQTLDDVRKNKNPIKTKREQKKSSNPTTTDANTKRTHNDLVSKYETRERTGSQSAKSNNHCDDFFGRIRSTGLLASISQNLRSFINLTNKRNARPRHMGSIPSINIDRLKKEQGIEKAERKRQKHAGYGCFRCSPCCTMVSILSSLLLLAGLAALFIALIGMKKKPAVTTTQVTTEIVTTTITTTTTTTSTTISTTTATSTTTTAAICGQSCLNQSWIDTSGDLAWWPFEGSYADQTGVYNGYPSASLPDFVTGYIGQAASFNASVQQNMFTPFIPLNNVSFTVEAWIKPTGFPNSIDHSIVGLCVSKTNDYCLHINIRSSQLYFGFYSDDAQGATTILVNQWIHTAFVFDAIARIQTIYLNGFQDGQKSNSNVLRVTAVNFTIGTNQAINTPNNYFQGYIDELSINRRPMSSCEVLERATLAAYFKFDIPSSYNDSGPNAIATTSGTTSIITGYRSQAISFTGASSSFFQGSGFTSLGLIYRAFSITFWIQPQILSGTLLHLSSSSTGTGSTCFPLLGFASNGTIVAQVMTSSGVVVTATGPVLSVSSSWISLVQTWSTVNGLKLYVNSILVSSIAASTFLGSGTTPNYLTLGGCLSGCGVCANGSVGAPGPFMGAIDDWRIYSRELPLSDVCTLYYSV